MEKIEIILGTRRIVWEWNCHITRVKIRIVTKQNQAVLKQPTLQSLIQELRIGKSLFFQPELTNRWKLTFPYHYSVCPR